MTNQDLDAAREVAWREYKSEPPYFWKRDAFEAGWDARGEYDQQRIAALVAALEEERGKFQRETLRTSELTALLLRVEKLHSDRGHEPGAWSRGCPDCALVAEARALIATPINLRALGQSEEATSA